MGSRHSRKLHNCPRCRRVSLIVAQKDHSTVGNVGFPNRLAITKLQLSWGQIRGSLECLSGCTVQTLPQAQTLALVINVGVSIIKMFKMFAFIYIYTVYITALLCTQCVFSIHSIHPSHPVASLRDFSSPPFLPSLILYNYSTICIYDGII